MLENCEKDRIDEMIKNEEKLRQGKMEKPVGNNDTNWYEMEVLDSEATPVHPVGSKYYVNNWSDDSAWDPPPHYYRYGDYANIPTKANSGIVFKYPTDTGGGYKKKYKSKYRNIKKSQKRTRTKNRRVKSRRY